MRSESYEAFAAPIAASCAEVLSGFVRACVRPLAVTVAKLRCYVLPSHSKAFLTEKVKLVGLGWVMKWSSSLSTVALPWFLHREVVLVYCLGNGQTRALQVLISVLASLF